MVQWGHKVRDAVLAPELALAIGTIPGITLHRKFGRNSDIGTGTTPEDVWNGGGPYTGMPLSFTAETVDVVSDSINDTAAGTGARTVRLVGLDGDFYFQVEDLTLNGTTAVTSTKTWSRMQRMRVLTAGTGEKNTGALTATATTTPAVVFAVMPQGLNRTAICAFTVPVAKSCFIRSMSLSSSKSGPSNWVSVQILTREPGGVFEVREFTDLAVASGENPIALGILLPEKTDVIMRVSEVSANGTAVSASIFFLILDEIDLAQISGISA